LKKRRMEKILTGIGEVKGKHNPGVVLFFISISVLVLSACSSSIKINKEIVVMDKNDKETIFSMIVEHPDLQQYFHQEERNRVPLRVKTNENLGVDLSVVKFGKPVEFYIHIDFDSDVPLFEVVLFSIDGDNAMFNILYAVEGITIKGELKKHNGQWLFVEFEVFES